MDQTYGAIGVPVANLWTEPGAKRPHDSLILSVPTDTAAWADSMDDEMRLWLVGKVDTQVLFGERVLIIDRRDDWLKVIACDQSTSLDPRGYPGWVPASQVAINSEFLTQQQALTQIVVTAKTAKLYLDEACTLVGDILSYQSRLPLLRQSDVTVALILPDGGTGYMASSDVKLTSELSFDGSALVEAAKQFSGLRYIWGGTSAYGFDCSGFTYRLYQAHGLLIPRDADDQAHAGQAVDRSSLLPGDLLFYAHDQGQGAIHHVAVYAGDGQMIHAPNSRSAVRIQPYDEGVYGEEFWGARRYI